MSKVSCLPKPNVMVLDEVFGKVANVNLEYVGDLLEKCSEYIPNLFIITHNTLAKDWAKSIITVIKEDDVSSLKLA